MFEIIKVCLVDEYNNKSYHKFACANEVFNFIKNLDFIIDVIEYKDYQFKNEIKECDYVLEEFIY